MVSGSGYADGVRMPIGKMLKEVNAHEYEQMTFRRVRRGPGGCAPWARQFLNLAFGHSPFFGLAQRNLILAVYIG